LVEHFLGKEEVIGSIPIISSMPEQIFGQNFKKEIEMAKSKNIRQIIILESTANTGFRYSTKKNKREHPNRVEYKKYDPVVRKHVIFKETK
jgi:large subunit ribosomal protein L33